MVDAAREKELKEARLRMLKFMEDHPAADLHAEVGVPRNATPDEINRAYKAHANRLHSNYAEKNYIESQPELKAQLEVMEKAAKDKAKALSDKELADFRATAPQRFDRMPEEQVRGIIADKEIDAGKRKLLAPHRGAIEYFSIQNEAKLKNIGMHRDILLNPDMMTHYQFPEKRVGAAHRPHAAGPQPAAEPPRATTPPPQPPPTGGNPHRGGEARAAGPQPGEAPRASARASAGPQANTRPDNNTDARAGAAAGATAQAAAGGGSGGGVPPAGDNGAKPDADGDGSKKGYESKYETMPRKPHNKAFAIKAAFAAVAVAAASVIGTKLMLGGEEDNKVTNSPVKVRTYETASKLAERQGTERNFVEQALGVAGLGGVVMKDRGKSLQDKTGITPQQFAKLSTVLNSEDVKSALTAQMKTAAQVAKVVLAQEADGRYVVVDAVNPDKKYKDSPTVTIDLSKPEVKVTAEDPRNGKGPQSATFANTEMAQLHLIADPAARTTAMGKVFEAAEASTAAAKAASAASAAEAAKKSAPKP